MKGQVVRGIAGRRETYRPIQSALTTSCEPLQVAEAFQNQLGLSQFYVADLDAIQFQEPQLSLLHNLAEAFPGLWLDCGLRTASDVPHPLVSQKVTFIAGLETLKGPQSLHHLCQQFGPQRIVFSLDLKAGLPMGELKDWQGSSPWDIAQEAIAAGAKKLIVLDLAQVGVGGGISTLPLCLKIKREFPHVAVITGGGIRHMEDLVELESFGIDGVLISSALHDGSIGREQLFRVAALRQSHGNSQA